MPLPPLSPPAAQDGIGSICHLCRDPTGLLTSLTLQLPQRRLVEGHGGGAREGLGGGGGGLPIGRWIQVGRAPPIDKTEGVRPWLP